MHIIDVIVANKAIILGVLLGVSESLALIPGIQANSVFQLILNGLRKAKQLLIGA